MHSYKESLIECLDAYENNLPERFKGEVDPRMEGLDKETYRSKYLFDILENALLVLDNKDVSTSERRLKKSLCVTLKHHIESGGAGSEALTRMVALGILEEMPTIKITDDTEWVPIKKSKMFFNFDEKEIDLYLYFNANPSDRFGKETWSESSHDGNVCIAQIKLNLKDRNSIVQFLDKLHSDYSDLMEVKYPDR